MKIFYIRYKTIYLILAMLIILIVILALLINNRVVNTFNNNDVFYKGNVNEKIIAFTCNIDWGNEYIPKMLEIFRQHNIKITFFVTGRWAEKYSDLLMLIHNEGHEIGNHGYLHRDYSLLSYELNKKEIEKADIVIKRIIGIKPKYFAPPSGAFNRNTVRAAKDLNYEIIMWSIDTIDWKEDSTKDKIINRVVSNPHKSAIVLMHPKEETVRALPHIIENLKSRGYSIGRVSDVIK